MIRTAALRRRAGVAAAMGVRGLLVSAGCGGPQEAEWARAAEARAAEYDAAWGIGMSNAPRFCAEDVEVDERTSSGCAGLGSAGFMQSTRDPAQDLPAWLGGRDTTDVIPRTRNDALSQAWRLRGARHARDDRCKEARDGTWDARSRPDRSGAQQSGVQQSGRPRPRPRWSRSES